MANRGHGEGSIYQRKDGRWCASISLENRKRKTFYGKTRKEVQEKLRVALNEQQKGTLITGPQQTVKQFLENWLEQVHKPTLRVSSYSQYRKILDNHLIPTLGHIQLTKLTPQQVQGLYTRKLDEGLAPKTIKLIHAVLRKALSHAVRWNLVSRNVCDVVTLPRRVKREIHPLTKEQCQKLLEAAKGHRLEALLTVAIATGVRRGELLALRWQDINFEKGTLHIRRTVNRIAGIGYVENEPKTASSTRSVSLPQFVIDALKKHRVDQLEARLKAGSAWQDNDLVFCNPSGVYFRISGLFEMFKRLLEDAGLPDVRFHDLRHSAATILLTMGVHPKIVQELLGHSQISMTLDTYSYLLPSLQQDTMRKLHEEFGRDDADGQGKDSKNAGGK